MGGCGNIFSVFQEDPQDMPGQGLARTDNYRNTTADGEYQSLLKSYLAGLPTAIAAENTYGSQSSAARLKSLQTTLSGNSEQAGVSKVYLDALRLADPESAKLLDSLTSTATSELALDNQLDPNQNRSVEQSGRASAAARGLGFGPNDAFAESFAKLGYGENLRQQRRGSALDLAKLRMALAARPADVATNAAMSVNPNLISSDQMFGVLNNVYGQNQQNNRTQSGLETQVGMQQAEIWNDWGKTAATGGLGGGGKGGGGGVSSI
jgi:hypothetical protein